MSAERPRRRPTRRVGALLMWAALALASQTHAQPAPAPKAERPPRIRFETTAGAFTVETAPQDAPQTVAHIVALVQTRFYDGLRVHRAQPGFVVQFGDPQTRDDGKRGVWGRGAGASSGTPIGVAEVSARRRHRAGAVGVAHRGEPAQADSQIYITLDARPELDGQYAVFGQVVEGVDVPSHLHVGDLIVRAVVLP